MLSRTSTQHGRFHAHSLCLIDQKQAFSLAHCPMMQVEKESKSMGLEKKDTMNRARWRVGLREIAAGVNPATPVYGDKPAPKLD